jgi:hypothetical protein
MFIIKYDTPMFLINQKKDEEAKRAIKRMFHKDEDHQAIYEYLKIHTYEETDKVSFL